MPFDIDSLKDKLPSEMLDKLRAYVDDLSTRAETAEDKARKAARESIEGRKTLKAERDAAFERLGVSTLDELEALPDQKGQADAVKQMEARLKKAERERDEAIQGRDALTGELKSMKRSSALTEAIQGHRFKNPADVQVLLERRLVEDGDELRFKTDDGKLVPLRDGAAWFAKTRPDYVEASEAGGQGSGFKGAQGGGGGSQKTKTRSEWDQMDHVARASFAKEGGQVVDA